MITPDYSIVIPAYNESARIAPTLDRVLAYIQRQGWEAEIVVVNDGSRDDTAEIVRDYADGSATVRLVENPGNRGKGYSVRNGVLHAKGAVVLFTDADLSSPIEEAAKLFDSIHRGNDIAIGSRWLRSDLQTTRQSILRQVLGRVFNLALRVVLGLGFKDTQCGFKAFKQQAARDIFARQVIQRWGFDPEILFLARQSGYRTEEIPVAWAHDGRSKINPLSDGMSMVMDMFRIRWNSISGKYDCSPQSTLSATAEEVLSPAAEEEPVGHPRA
jgi:glycosyltransferase involved in cell wall biosynthesis